MLTWNTCADNRPGNALRLCYGGRYRSDNFGLPARVLPAIRGAVENAAAKQKDDPELPSRRFVALSAEQLAE
jgi:hypothetical protein